MSLTKATYSMIEGAPSNVLDYGASPSASASVNAAAIQAAIDALPQNGTLDLAGETYDVDVAIVINKRMVLQNGVLNQTTEAQNTLEVPGPLAYGPTLKNIGLTHAFTTSSAGALLDLSSGGNLGFFTWDGSLGISSGGYYGVRSHGGTYMMRFNRVWMTNLYSSGFYLPASGDVVSGSATGGSTTTWLTHCFVSNIQTADPAYAIGTGYDTVRLENCSADSVTNFGYFKAQPLQIVNCSSENVRNPIVGSLTGAHYFINMQSGAGQEVNGFHVVFNSGFVAPTPSAGTANCFVYSINAGNLEFAGVRGSLPSGYYMLNQEGGQAFVNSASIGSGIRNTSNANYSAPNYSVAQAENAHTFNRLPTSGGSSVGNIVEFQANSSTVGSVSVDASNNVVLNSNVNSSAVVLSAKTSGGVADSIYYNANVASLFPISDNTNSLGRSGYRWSVVYAGTGTINTSDATLKQQIRSLTDVEKAVALKVKAGIKAFKFNDAVQKKSNSARVHFGVIAQEVKAAFESEGLDASNYGLFCSDTLEDGTIRLGIRYEELLAFVIAAL